ncbi:MAG TPA: hypothetical protein DCW88_22715 [Agrobacterium sp.]|uniref:hypothetical protein n=1 Tax=Agrobacterium pusense TaxID=648995 RepID=UPI000E8FC0A0|nr:hypothetical protein [Agrobacterium pusense]MDH0871525.1 hypothetical protein [Agrobacterium pusense]MDH1268738.1 hypothetical protein [Agrobacterium pusense]HAU78220.1 hypothetical protein [Agrobacterium sp.]
MAEPRDRIKPEEDLNRPVSEEFDSKYSPVGVDDGAFRGRERTWKRMMICALVIFALAIVIALSFLVGTHPGRVS